jgi:small-conductance mechanosensitive channel
VPELAPWIPVAAAVLVSVVVLVTVARLPVHREEPARPTAGRFRRQLALVVLAHLAMLVLILTLPVRDELRAQLLSLFGLVFTAIIALSSTTFVSNAMAGLMLRSLGNFHAGDFVLVGEHFGRVTERGLLHTEIQTEDRDLVTVPNLFLITQPVRVVRGSGTIVSCELSLGYDVPRERLTALLQEAARSAELEEPFVLVTDLGDFAVTYRVAGFLADVRRLVTARSALRAAVLDTLHGAGVEIVSPTFMNQRQLEPGRRLLPRDVAEPPPSAEHGVTAQEAPADDGDVEAIIFDKAETAQRLVELRRSRERLAAELEALRAGDGGADALDERQSRLELAWRERQLEALDATLAAEDGADAEAAATAANDTRARPEGKATP